MRLTSDQKELLKKLMKISARKGNLANAGFVLDNKIVVASAESWVVSSSDAGIPFKDASSVMLVETVCKLKHTNYTPGLTMVSVVEPCLMCMSACSQAGYKEICYIIPAKKYVKKIPWMTDTVIINKILIANQFTSPIKLIYLKEYEEEFSNVFEIAHTKLLK